MSVLEINPSEQHQIFLILSGRKFQKKFLLVALLRLGNIVYNSVKENAVIQDMSVVHVAAGLLRKRKS
jgi:hypothetical protein